MEVQSGIERLLGMQKKLMEEVPHNVSPSALTKMSIGMQIIDTLLRYLNSTGHKPWRPVPLSPIVQQGLLKELKDKVGLLSFAHSSNVGADEDLGDVEHHSRQVISYFGIVEEATEYMNSMKDSTEAEQLEELTDILFFYLELMALGGRSWAEIEEEYIRKWNVNMDRYKRAKGGDYSWDKRGEGGL